MTELMAVVVMPRHEALLFGIDAVALMPSHGEVITGERTDRLPLSALGTFGEIAQLTARQLVARAQEILSNHEL